MLKIASTQNYEKYNQREVEVYQRAIEEGDSISHGYPQDGQRSGRGSGQSVSDSARSCGS